MFRETIQLETLRQKIEDAEIESGGQSDYLDRGKPNAGQAKRAQDMIDKLNDQINVSKMELSKLIAMVRLQSPQAINEWVNFHTDILQKIINEAPTMKNAKVRENLAKGALQQWRKVLNGEQDYVRINWYFLKDYRESAKKITAKSSQDWK
jgi:hypothetical protein